MPAPYPRLGAASALFNRVETIPGYFNCDDAQHFWLLLELQAAAEMPGDLLEIGTWKGRSAAFLSFFVRSGERLYLSDVFSAPATDKYPEYPSADSVRDAVLGLNPDAAGRMVFIEGDSRQLALPGEPRLRFAHVDGGHSFDECLADLRRVGPLVCAGGVVAVDDYDHPDWPEVKPATDQWLAENPAFQTIGDLNRNGARGRKLYAMRRRSAP